MYTGIRLSRCLQGLGYTQPDPVRPGIRSATSYVRSSTYVRSCTKELRPDVFTYCGQQLSGGYQCTNQLPKSVRMTSLTASSSDGHGYTPTSHVSNFHIRFTLDGSLRAPLTVLIRIRLRQIYADHAVNIHYDCATHRSNRWQPLKAPPVGTLEFS